MTFVVTYDINFEIFIYKAVLFDTLSSEIILNTKKFVVQKPLRELLKSSVVECSQCTIKVDFYYSAASRLNYWPD